MPAMIAGRAGEARLEVYPPPVDDLTDGGREGEELDRRDLAIEEVASEEVEVAVL